MNRQAKAEVAQLRQQTQYTCCATSIAAALRAHGKNVSEDDVNRVLDASPMAGASWEAMLATVQYFGCRGTLVVPATPRMLKAWTDAGVPVVIAWNPEGRPWSHASTVYDVVEGEDGKLTVYVMDPNIPNPTETTRILGEDEFCQKWGEKVSESLIMRRPAMAVEREVTTDGRQVMASTRTAGVEKVRWVPLSGGGVKFVDEDVLVFITPKDAYEEFQDPNIPSWNDLTNDGELFADGIPELMESGVRLERDLAKWQQQGWWPNRRKVQHWLLAIMHRPTKKAFEAEFETLREAQTRAEQAIPSVRLRRRPSWLQISKEAGGREIDRLGHLQVMASSNRQSAYRNWEKERFKRQELRHELWEEDNPGLAAYREQQRRDKARADSPSGNMTLKDRISYFVIYEAIQRLKSNDPRKVGDPLGTEFAKPGIDSVIVPNRTFTQEVNAAYKEAGLQPPNNLHTSTYINMKDFDVEGFLRKYPRAEWNPSENDLKQVQADYLEANRQAFLNDIKQQEDRRTESALDTIEAELLIKDISRDLLRRYDDKFYRLVYGPSSAPTTFLIVDDSGLFAYGGPETEHSSDWFDFLDKGEIRFGQFPPEVAEQVLSKPHGSQITISTLWEYLSDAKKVWEGTFPKGGMSAVAKWALTASAYILRAKRVIDDVPREQTRALYEAEQRRVEEEKRRVEEEKRRVEEEKKQRVKTVVDSALAKKFTILDTLIARGDAAAKASANEVKAVYESGGTPTEDQLKRLRNMLYRTRMRDEANHFRVASVDVVAKRPTPVQPKKDKDTVSGPPPARRNPVVQQMIERGSAGAGKHHNREDDVDKGRSRKPKHKKRWEDRDAEVLTAAWGDTL